MILTLDAKRRLTLPANLVSARPGDNFEAVFDPEEDAVIFRRLSKGTNLADGPRGLSRQDGRPSAANARASQTDQALSWLLDFDVLSQPAKKVGNARVITWLEKHPVLHEFNCGRTIGILGTTDLIEAMQGRILGFNVSTAHGWAEQQHQFQASGKPMPVEDSYIAAIARRHNLTVVTGNVNVPQNNGLGAAPASAAAAAFSISTKQPSMVNRTPGCDRTFCHRYW